MVWYLAHNAFDEPVSIIVSLRSAQRHLQYTQLTQFYRRLKVNGDG
jgi:hypothetical protein